MSLVRSNDKHNMAKPIQISIHHSDFFSSGYIYGTCITRSIYENSVEDSMYSNKSCTMISGAQLEIFEGRGLIYKKGHNEIATDTNAIYIYIYFQRGYSFG